LVKKYQKYYLTFSDTHCRCDLASWKTVLISVCPLMTFKHLKQGWATIFVRGPPCAIIRVLRATFRLKGRCKWYKNCPPRAVCDPRAGCYPPPVLERTKWHIVNKNLEVVMFEIVRLKFICVFYMIFENTFLFTPLKPSDIVIYLKISKIGFRFLFCSYFD
jgi:hypothetical protein